MTDRRGSRGFSLVEILVGVTIGILSSIVVFQVFALSERQKRTTTGAADAQTNGAVALYMMERDIKTAGWGLENASFANCATVFSYLDDGVSPAGPVSDLFASATIADGGAGPDAITLQYYDDPSNPNFKFSVTTLGETMPQPSAELNVRSTYGCDVDDLVMVIQGSSCTLMQITQVQGPALKLQHAPGGSPSYNPPAAYQNANGWPAYTTDATLQCFSQLFRRTYRITASQLELQEPNAAGVTQTFQIAPGILDMQAQYGVAAAGSQQVTSWVDATGAWASPLTTVNARRVKALRIALVARSSEYEKPDATGACNTTTGAMVAGWSTWAVFDTGAWPADWQCYRYKVFETVVPLRNIIWANL